MVRWSHYALAGAANQWREKWTGTGLTASQHLHPQKRRSRRQITWIAPEERTAGRNDEPGRWPSVWFVYPDNRTPEDTILFKPEWYRLSNEALDQQWKNILGVLKVQAGRLDEAYLEHWAAELHLSDQLVRARREIPR